MQIKGFCQLTLSKAEHQNRRQKDTFLGLTFNTLQLLELKNILEGKDPKSLVLLQILLIRIPVPR